MERFLRYSLERQRAIRLMYVDDKGAMKQVNATVCAMDEQQVELSTLRPKRQLTLPRQSLLAADYKKGDEGMTE